MSTTSNLISRPAVWPSCIWTMLLAFAAACGEPSTGAAAGPPLDTPAPQELDSAPAPPGTPPAEGPLVIFLGDSISAGLHLEAARAFPAVLARRLAQAGSPFRLVNAGVSGATLAMGRTRVSWLLGQQPDILVVQLGANDGLRGVDLKRIEADLRAVITEGQSAGVRVLLLGMRLPPSYGEDYAGGFAGIYDRVAAVTGAAYIPHFMEGVAGDPDLNLKDGIHPTAEGHEILAGKVEPALRRLVVEAAAGR